VVTVAYPVFVYLGLTRLSFRSFGLFLIAGAAAVAVLRGATGGGWRALFAPLVLVLLVALAWALSDERFVLFYPVLMSGGLLVVFASSLRSELSLIERFALRQHPDLSATERRYCRRWTIGWSGFFVGNGALAAGLALWAPLGVWAAYTGFFAYVVMGSLLVGEYVYRKYRFGRFDDHFVDRTLQSLLSTRAKRGAV
jgi:uncharacterized membrane protein